MIATSLDRLLANLAVHLHSTSVCIVGEGWRLAFAAFEAMTVHHVLAGTGVVRIGNGPPLPYHPGNIIVVPPRQSHVLGDSRPEARQAAAEDRCSPFADGLVAFTAGGNGPATLLVCGAILAPHGQVLGLFDLLQEPVVETPPGDVSRHAFDLLRAEVAAPGLGTAAMTEALMKACLVALLRGRLQHEKDAVSHAVLPGNPRLARAVLAVLENPGAPHTVASLAERVGMSRASFADHFARALEVGPMEFVQAVRLRAAARLLGTTDLPLKVVAAAVGYAGATSLSRAFRSAYGTDPTRYRGALGKTELVEAQQRDTSSDSAPHPAAAEESGPIG